MGVACCVLHGPGHVSKHLAFCTETYHFHSQRTPTQLPLIFILRMSFDRENCFHSLFPDSFWKTC